MKVLLVSCLLIGSVACSPVGKGYGSNGAQPTLMRQPFSSGYQFMGRGVSSDLGSSSSLPSHTLSSGKAAGRPAQDVISNVGLGSYGSSPNAYNNMAQGTAFNTGYAAFSEGYNSPGVSEYGVAYAAPQPSGYGSYSGVYGGSPSAYAGDGSYGFVSAPRDENLSSGSATSYGASEEEPEPVFSDVSDLEPVYSFSSRSSYQRGRAVFAQTHYSPGEPVAPPMPVARRSSQPTLTHNSPANAPTKGGF